MSDLKVFYVECPILGEQYDSIMVGESRNKVRYESQQALNNAGWRVKYTDIKVSRRPIFDSIVDSSTIDEYVPYAEEVGYRKIEAPKETA